MDDKKYKLIQWALYGLMAISALLGVIFYINPSSPDILIYWGYFLTIVSIVIALGLTAWGMFKNPTGSKKILIMAGVALILAVISYTMSKNTLSPTDMEKYQISANGVRLVGAGLYLTYFIGVIAIGVLIYTNIARYRK